MKQFCETILLELFDIRISQAKAVFAIAWRELDFAFAEVKPAATIIGHLFGSELFVRVIDPENRAASCLERLLEQFLRFQEIHFAVKDRRAHKHQRISLSGLGL